MIALLVVLALFAIIVAAPVWGVDTRDGSDSLEWERRRTWRGHW